MGNFYRGALLALVTASSAIAVQLSLPITTDGVQKYFEANPSHRIEQFLKDLPPSYTGSFVLIHNSHSLQQATYEKPRVVYFGPDARFLLAVGNVPEDPRSQTLEFAELDEVSGIYRFGEVDLRRSGAPKVIKNPASCTLCHGNPARPVWGQYPHWEGTYSDEAGKIAAVDQPGFSQFLKTRMSDPRLALLQFNSGSDYFVLSSRAYPYANTDLNHELGNTIARATLTRLRRDPNFNSYKWAVLATSDALYCLATDAWFDIAAKLKRLYPANLPSTPLAFVKSIRLLGVDPDLELSLESLVPSLKNPALKRTYGQWQTGAFRMDEALAFNLLDELVAEDPELAKLFVSEKSTMKQIAAWTSLKGEARAEMLKGDDGAHFYYFDVFDPIIKSKKRHEQVCAYLAEKIPGT